MTINVATPDGGSVSFPEGTDAGTINSVMAEHFGAGKSQPSPATAPGTDSSISTNNLVRSAATGIPILGGLANKANAAINAGLAPALNPLFAEKDQLKGGTFGERYSESLGQQNEMDRAFHEAHPIADTAANIAGGVAATLPVAGTALGARALGLTGRTLPAQIAQGAASGAGINAADAVVRGENPLSAGMVGGAIGGAAPAVARGVGALAAPAVNTVRGIINPADEAARRVTAAVGRDVTAGGAGLAPAEFAQASAAGGPVNLLDMGGETTRALARSAANTSPEGRQILNRAIDDRFEGQGGRLTDWLNSTFHYPNAAAQQTALEQSQRIGNNANYARAMQEGSGGIWSPALEALSGSDAVAAAMKKAASVARDENIVSGYGAMNPHITFTPDGRIQFAKGPSGVPTYPDLQFWDLTRRQLSNGAAMARRAGDMEEARRLGNFAGRLNTELDVHVPSYATARGTHAAFEGAQNALEAGQNFVTSRMSNDEARTQLARMSSQERQLFQDGFVSDFVQQLHAIPDRRSVLNKVANSPAARERLNIALGPQRANELEAMLRVEHVMDQARGAIQGNSTTARQLAELGLAGAGGSALSGGGNPFSDPTAMLNSMLVYGAMKGGRGALNAIDHRVSGEVARLLTSNNPAQLRLGMQMLGRNPRLLSHLRNADVALARSGAVAATPGDQRQQ